MQRLLLRVFRLILLLYPQSMRAAYADEMALVYEQVLSRASKNGKVEMLGEACRELASQPGVILRLYAERLPGRITYLIRHAPEWLASRLTSMPPVDMDGRSSWKHAGYEVLLFALFGACFLWEVYYRSGYLSWESPLFRIALLLMSIAALPVGLAKGMPRWAYPLAGLVLGSGAVAASWSGFLFLFIIMMSFGLILAYTAARMQFRFILLREDSGVVMGSGYTQDSRRLSFGVYGLLPLLLVFAYDNSYMTGRTPALAGSVLFMLIGALVFSRCRSKRLALAALVLGMTLSLITAFAELIYLRSGLWQNDLFWMAGLWLPPLVVMLLAAQLPYRYSPLHLLLKGRYNRA
jgi:hypothetical protein